MGGHEQQYLLQYTCPHNMVNFGPLTAEIGWRVWGTPENFNTGFTSRGLVVFCDLINSIQQTAPRTFGRAAITLGIGPHSSSNLFLV